MNRSLLLFKKSKTLIGTVLEFAGQLLNLEIKEKYFFFFF